MAERREFTGASVRSELSTSLGAAATTLVVNAASGWPTGGIGKFGLVIDPDKSNEEKVVCSARSGTTLTITQRGADGTSASSHAVGAICYPVYMAADADAANRHAAVATDDDHLQYVHNDNARTISADHTFTGDLTMQGALALSGQLDMSGEADFSDTVTFTDFGAASDLSTIDPANTAAALGTDHRPAPLKHTHKFMKQAVRDAVWEPGDIKVTAATTWSADWVECNGQELNRTTYALLFAALGGTNTGTRAGSGNGSTTFNVPDYRDLALSVAGSTRSFGSITGSDTTKVAMANMPRHKHAITDKTHKHAIDGDTGNRVIVTAPSTLYLGNAGTPGASNSVSITDIDEASTGITGTENSGGGSTSTDGDAEPISVVSKNVALRCLMKAA